MAATARALARVKASRAAYATLNRLAKEPWADQTIVRDLREHLRQALVHHKALQDDALTPQQAESERAAARIRRELNDAQSREILRLHDEGAINTATMTKIQRELDLEAVRRGTEFSH